MVKPWRVKALGDLRFGRWETVQPYAGKDVRSLVRSVIPINGEVSQTSSGVLELVVCTGYQKNAGRVSRFHSLGIRFGAGPKMEGNSQ